MDDATRIDHEQRPFANPFLASVDSVFARDFSLGFEIGKKRQMITPISGKGDMTPRAIYGNSQREALNFANSSRSSLKSASSSPHTGLQSAG